MKKVTKVFEVYRFEELSAPAKYNAIQYFIEDMRDCDIFTDICECKLADIFPNSTLNVEYQLDHCQGDYFNFYGDIDLNDILNQVISKLTEKQTKLFRHIIKSWKDTHTILPLKGFYNLNTAYNCHIFGGVIDDMECYGYRDIPEKDIAAIEDIAAELLSNICTDLMDKGYNYFYPDDTEIAEQYNDNDYYFTSDGKPYFD